MNKRVLAAILIFILSILAIVGAVLLFINVPNVEVFTPKEAGIMAGGVMLSVIGIAGIISALSIIFCE